VCRRLRGRSVEPERARAMAAVDVVTDVVIGCPVEEVASFASDPSNAPAWYENIKSVEWRTGPVLAVGSRVAFVAHFLGRRLSYVYEVVEWIPHRKLVMRTSEGPFPMETSYAWEPLDAVSTRMTLRNRGDPRGFARIVAPMMKLAMRRENRRDLRRLKQLLERKDGRG
jgi:uncharacterized membrane protein